MAVKSVTILCEFDGKKLQHDREAMRKFKLTLQPGQQIAMTLEEWGKVRTKAMQGLFHELLGRYARKNGTRIDVVKIGVKLDLGWYLYAKDLHEGTIDFPAWRGAFIDLAKFKPEFYPERTIIFLRSESSYTTRMESEAIEYAIKLCQEDGVEIDDILETLKANSERRERERDAKADKAP